MIMTRLFINNNHVSIMNQLCTESVNNVYHFINHSCIVLYMYKCISVHGLCDACLMKWYLRYLHIWCILIKINMLTGIVASCINPMISFMSIHTLFRIYCHYHHYNILYQNIITAKISREHTWHKNATLSLRLTTQGANVRGGPFSDPHQFTHFTDIL